VTPVSILLIASGGVGRAVGVEKPEDAGGIAEIGPITSGRGSGRGNGGRVAKGNLGSEEEQDQQSSMFASFVLLADVAPMPGRSQRMVEWSFNPTKPTAGSYMKGRPRR